MEEPPQQNRFRIEIFPDCFDCFYFIYIRFNHGNRAKILTLFLYLPKMYFFRFWFLTCLIFGINSFQIEALPLQYIFHLTVDHLWKGYSRRAIVHFG